MFNYEFGLAHIATADTVKKTKRKMEKKHVYELAVCRSCVSSVS